MHALRAPRAAVGFCGEKIQKNPVNYQPRQLSPKGNDLFFVERTAGHNSMSQVRGSGKGISKETP